MKKCLLCLTCFILSSSTAVSETEHASYFMLLEQARRPYSLDTARKGDWESWEGIATRSGLRLAVNELTRLYESNDYQTDGSALDFAWWMIEHSKLPEEDAAEVVVQLGDEYAKNPRRMYFLFRVAEEFGRQDAILKYLARRLGDTRAIELYRAYPDSRKLYPSSDTRICDAATGSLIVCLSKRGLWRRDAAMKDNRLSVGEKRHLAIDRINQILMDEGVIQYAVSPSDPVPRDRDGRRESGAGIKKVRGQRAVEAPASGEDPPIGTVFPRWALGLALGLILVAIALGLKIRAKKQAEESI